jgi:hypothetical protein
MLSKRLKHSKPALKRWKANMLNVRLIRTCTPFGCAGKLYANGMLFCETDDDFLAKVLAAIRKVANLFALNVANAKPKDDSKD